MRVNAHVTFYYGNAFSTVFDVTLWLNGSRRQLCVTARAWKQMDS